VLNDAKILCANLWDFARIFDKAKLFWGCAYTPSSYTTGRGVWLVNHNPSSSKTFASNLRCRAVTPLKRYIALDSVWVFDHILLRFAHRLKKTMQRSERKLLSLGNCRGKWRLHFSNNLYLPCRNFRLLLIMD